MKRKFINFLSSRNAYEDYEENALKDHHVCFESISKRHEPDKWVLAAFDWAKTKQGEIFWSKINKEWIELLISKN